MQMHTEVSFFVSCILESASAFAIRSANFVIFVNFVRFSNSKKNTQNVGILSVGFNGLFQWLNQFWFFFLTVDAPYQLHIYHPRRNTHSVYSPI